MIEWVGWSPFRQGWVSLNTDGSFQQGKNLAGGGDLLRDHNGSWLHGFSVWLGHYSAVEGELWALFHGLRLAWERGHRLMNAEIDSLLVLNWVTNEASSRNKYSNLIEECKQLLHRTGMST